MLFSLSAARLSTAETRSRLICLAGVTAPIAGAGLLNFCLSNVRLSNFWAERDYPVFWMACPIRSLTGIPCPTCGMTRSFLAAARGDWSEAIGYHAFGLLLFLMLLTAALHLLLELGIQRRVHTVYGRWVGNRRWQLMLVAVLLLYYGIRLQHWTASGELLAAMQASPVARLLF